jgi:hypothetical protein
VVYLAEVSDDLEDLRDELKRYLVQRECRVLPENRLPDDIAGFENAALADLKRSDVFVQILSEVAGRKFDGGDRRRVPLQYDLAGGRSMPVVLWRSRTLDVDKVKDPAHLELLNSAMALEIQELKETIVERVRAALASKPAPKETGGIGFFVVVDAEEDELERVIEDGLRQRKFGCAIRPREGDPRQLDAAFAEVLTGSQALLLAFGQTEPIRAYRRVNQSRHILATNQAYPKVLAVYEGPPPKNDRWLPVSGPNLHVMRCSGGLDSGEIDRFVTFLRASYSS